MEPLSALDASFLDIEDDNNHMHIGSVGIFEGPTPNRQEMTEAIAAKLHLVPRYRQRVRFPPLRVGPPVWIDDPHFNLDYHVRHTGLPDPGGEVELRTLVGRVMSQQLDRAKPLWEMWVAGNLGGGRWALISKTHHCMVDGVSATDLLSVMLDSEREPPRASAPRWTPRPEPGAAELIAQPLARRLVTPIDAASAARTFLRGPRQVAELAVSTARGTAAMRRLLQPTPRTSLNGPVGPHRRWAWAHAQLSDVKAVRAGLGGTINDVVLTAITRGFRDLLSARGESLDGRFIRTLVPVSVRRPGEKGTYNNRVSAMYADLPVCIEDPTERLDAVRRQLDDLKRSQQAVAGEVLTSLTGFAPSLLLALGTRVAFRLPQRSLNTVTTNVPGPQRPLYLCARRMLEAIPYVPLGGQVRVGVAIFSYDGALKFGVTGDYDTAPDIEVLCHGIERGMAELLRAAEAAQSSAAAAEVAAGAEVASEAGRSGGRRGSGGAGRSGRSGAAGRSRVSGATKAKRVSAAATAGSAAAADAGSGAGSGAVDAGSGAADAGSGEAGAGSTADADSAPVAVEPTQSGTPSGGGAPTPSGRGAPRPPSTSATPRST